MQKTHCRPGRIIRLEAAPEAGLRRFLSELPALPDGEKKTTWVTLTRTGTFTDPRYGTFDITRTMLQEMVANFDKGTYGQDIFLDVAHKPQDGAAAKILKLSVEGDRLRALVEWTPFGLEAVEKRGFRYLSAEYHENWKDNEAGNAHGCVLLGGGLVTRPCIKRLDPVQLSEAGGGDAPVLLHPTLKSQLLKEHEMKFAELLKKLQEQLAGLKLSEAVIADIAKAAAKALESVEDEGVAKSLCEGFADAGKAMAAQLGDKPAVIQLSMPAPGQVDVAGAVAKALADRDAATKKLAEDLEAKRKTLSEQIGAAAGLDEDLRKSLTESAAGLITPEMTADQVKRLGETMIAQGNQIAAAKKLSGYGYHVAGRAHIEVPDEAPKKLTEMVHAALKQTGAYHIGALALPEKEHPFVTKVLAEFDARHGQQLHNELKLLSGGQANTGDYYMPAAIQREVIRVALSDLNVLQLVRTATDPKATATTEIPFEVRPTAALANDGIVYEGQGIPRYQTRTDHETAFLTPMKLGMKWTNELAFLTRNGPVAWDAVGENLSANARLMREMIARRVANELQRASDSFGAIAVSAENISSQFDGSKSQFKTANFPVVRPFQARDLKGNAVGIAENPITVVIAGTAIQPWDGTGKQAAGTYYRVLNWNLGYFQVVDKDGNPVTPAGTGTNTVAYSKASNVMKVDLDVPAGSTNEKQLNKLLQAVGSRKAMLASQRYVGTDFLLMSPSLNDTITNAEQFEESHAKNGTVLAVNGDLQTIKGVPAVGTNQPGIDLGDERIILGSRGLLGYTVAKPYAIEGAPFEVVDSSGNPTGEKQVYGEEYNVIKVPGPVSGYMTSILAYSDTNR